MAKFDISINGVDKGAADAREAWAGELPPTGSYEGVLKVLSIGEIGEGAENAGEPKLFVGVELRNTEDGKYDGYVAGGNLNLIEGSEAYVNQFLFALTDGSDEQFALIKKAFYVTKPDTDERQKHITDIGRWKINSPKGELPIKVSLENKPYYNSRTKQTTDSVRIVSYLVSEKAVKRGGTDGGTNQIVQDEEEAVVVPDEDEAEALLAD